ncbi:MAG: hypothetical protein P4L98_09560 [Ancalomicrobiaceae bacterium]|nr:hypothetical protein [Ancalomicrobiaceae bacterium]
MGDNSFDISFKALPPDLQIKLWVLGLDANTSQVNLAYKPGNYTLGLAYNYGGNLEASLAVRRFRVTLGANPGNGNVDLGLVFRGFNFGASASPAQRSGGLTLSYGAGLLPFPDELSKTFNEGEHGFMNIMGDIQAAPDNPLAWYGLHSNDIGTIGKAVALGKSIADTDAKKSNFGFGLRIAYNPQTQLSIYGGAQWFF